MSIRRSVCTTRRFSIGIRLWPPASTFARSPCVARAATACSTVPGRSYSKTGGFIVGLLPGRGPGDGLARAPFLHWLFDILVPGTVNSKAADTHVSHSRAEFAQTDHVVPRERTTRHRRSRWSWPERLIASKS